MATAARWDIASWRNEARTFTILVRGLDLTGVTLRQQVRDAPDTPGEPIIALETVTDPAAEGLRLESVTIEEGVPVSRIVGRYDAETMRDNLPYGAEIGQDYRLSHAIQIDGVTRLYGDWWARATPMDSNNADTNGDPGYGRASRSSDVVSGATLTIASDDVATLAIDGAELIAGEVQGAKTARVEAAADAARAKSEADAAKLARDASAAAGRYFTSRVLGESGSATNQFFSTDDGAGNLIYYKKTSGGSTEVGRALTPAALSAADGAKLVGYGVRTTGAKLDERVSLLDFRFAPDADDSAALARAKLAAVARLYLPAGKGLGLNGAYRFVYQPVVGGVPQPGNLWSNLVLEGDGIGRTRVERTSTIGFVIDSLNPNPLMNIRNVVLRGIEIFADDTLPFSEGDHLVAFSGVTNVLIEQCAFTGFRGDGFYLGSSYAGGLERHNQGVTFRKCIFNGVDNENRNGISIIDGDTVVIDDCDFINCTKLDGSMPGAIDAEPNNPTFAIVRNIYVMNSRFKNCGGAGVAFLLKPNTGLTTPMRNLHVIRCSFYQCRAAVSFFGEVANTNTSTQPYGLFIEGNLIERCGPFYASVFITGIYGVQFRSNVFTDSQALVLGFQQGVRDGVFENNRYVRSGSGATDLGCAVIVDNDLVGVRFRGEQYIDVGRENGTVGRGVYFRGAAANLDFSMEQPVVENASGRMTQFIQRVGGATGTVAPTSYAKGSRIPAGITKTAGLALPGVAPDQLSGSVTADVASIAAQQTGIVTIPVPGAAVGDFVVCAPSSALEAGLSLSAFVVAADTVQVRLSNPTAAAIDPVNRTYKARVFKDGI